MNVLSPEAVAEVRKRVEERVRNRPRPSIPRQVPYTHEHLQERARFVAERDEMCRVGEAKHFLEWTNEYDGSHLEGVTALTYIDGKEFVDSDAEWETRTVALIEKEVARELAQMEKHFRSVVSS